MDPVTIPDLWLPTLLATVAVYLAMWVSNMLLPFYRKYYQRLSNENAVCELISGENQGLHFFPYYGDAEYASTQEFKERMEKGPVGILVIQKTGASWTRQLTQQFIYTLCVSLAAGYVGTASLTTGAEYLEVFQTVGAAAFLAYGAANFGNSIWFGFPWRMTWLRVVDALVAAVLTAGFFGWLWPS